MSPEELIYQELRKRNDTITTAESCTGGLIAATLINVPGISTYYREGYITYANESKEKLLGVKKQTLQKYGAVSRQTAAEMALGAAKAAGADLALVSTGIAGPDGGSKEKPVGLVYIGCCVHGEVTVTENHFTGDRLSVRTQATEAALELLLRVLRNA